jgi:hypothetical protein
MRRLSAPASAGSLFTGAEDAKTEQQVALYGGLATFGSESVAFDLHKRRNAQRKRREIDLGRILGGEG